MSKSMTQTATLDRVHASSRIRHAAPLTHRAYRMTIRKPGPAREATWSGPQLSIAELADRVIERSIASAFFHLADRAARPGTA